MSDSAGLTQRIRRAANEFDAVDEREFLPAALEIIETPPSPTGRTLGVIIILFFAIAVAWAFIGKVDVLATAQGRILPAGEVKTIQPLDSGVVRAIDVQNGDHVRAGQLLVELDPTQTGADSDRLAGDLAQAKLDVARLTALSHAMETGRPPQMAIPPDVPASLAEEARASMQAQYDQQAAKVADLESQINQKGAEAGEVSARSDQITASIPMLAAKDHINSELRRQGYGTSLTSLDAQQQLSDARHELTIEEERGAQSRDAKMALERQREGAQSEYAADILGDLRKAQQQQNEMTQDLVKARNKTAQTELRSPIDGVVDQLAVHTLNGVVTPAQQLMIVVPDSRDLTIEARLEDRDVGFVHAGQAVKVKIETFNFTRYGLLDGRVIDVSRDVISQDSRRAGDSASPAAAAGGRAASPSYVARIALSKTSLMIDGHEEPLQPGMSITAEIKTGDRTIIDYLLSPLARRTSESLHER